MKQRILLFLLCANTILHTHAQSCTVQLQSSINSTCSQITLTMIHDTKDRPYLYVASKEGGMKIYDISNLRSPVLKATVPASKFASLHVMNLTQQDNYVYLAIGNHFNNKQASGMAIVDITDPLHPLVTSYWTLPSSSGGSGIVKVDGDYAFLGAMGNGLVILNVSDKSNIRYISKFVPDINYPTPNPKKSLYNARGMFVKDELVYLCYDAGGLRIINTKDKTTPVEVGRYSNQVMNGKARAYNNIIVDDSLAYITADYCGVEVLNVKHPSNIGMIGWWNPFGCPNNNWFTSPVHANEIQYDKKCNLLFVSTGKSDMYILNIADPSHPRTCREYGGTFNGIGTWGVGLYKEQIYLSYTCSLIPFTSAWTGIRILTYQNCGSK